MVDREPQPDPEIRFTVLKDELVAQMQTTYQENLQKHKNVVVRIVSNEWDGGSQALLLSSDGKWSGKMDMMGWDIGDVSFDDLLEDYTEIKDPAFEFLRREEHEAEMDYTRGASPEVHRIIDMSINRHGEEGSSLTPEEQTLLDAYHEGRDALEEEWEGKRQTYIEENKPRLSDGLLSEMDKVLQGLRNPQH